MIAYGDGGMCKMFQLAGSVSPRSLLIALPCATIAAVMRYLMDEGHLEFLSGENSILKETQVWNSFSFLAAFLVVFRTSQAYSRFWDGCTSIHQMRAEWFDACSALVSFCKHSKADEDLISRFTNTLIRLCSMLHAAALAELEEINAHVKDLSEIKAFSFDLIDPGGLDDETLKTLKFSTCKVEVVFSWLQMLIVENISTGVLSIPPPILSRSFQEIANGMVNFCDALKLTYIPFPFPYAQTCQCILIVHWLIVPFVTSQWVTSPAWAFIFVTIQVFVLWSLNYIAVEIENPFGADDNDLDGYYMQREMNRHLLLLLQKSTGRTPVLRDDACRVENSVMDEVPIANFQEIWSGLDGDVCAFAARKEDNFSRHSDRKAPGTPLASPKGRRPYMSSASPGSLDRSRKLTTGSLGYRLSTQDSASNPYARSPRISVASAQSRFGGSLYRASSSHPLSRMGTTASLFSTKEVPHLEGALASSPTSPESSTHLNLTLPRRPKSMATVVV